MSFHPPAKDPRQTLDSLIADAQDQSESKQNYDPLELVLRQGIEPEQPEFPEYIQFIQDYRDLLNRWRAEDQEKVRKLPTDWRRIRNHVVGGAILGTFYAGLAGAFTLASIYAAATFIEEKTEKVKSETAPSYMGAAIGGTLGVWFSDALVTMTAGMLAGLFASYLHWYDEAEHTEAALYRLSATLSDTRRLTLESLKKEYARRINWSRVPELPDLT